MIAPRLRRPRAALAALVMGALTLSGCSIYDVPLPGGVDTGDDPIEVEVMFRDVLDLVPQSTVKVDDVTVGKVTAIELDDYTAAVTIQLPKSIELPENTRAEIRQTSLLGEKFVSLSQPEQPVGTLDDKDVIDLENTGRNPEVEEVFSALALLLNGGGVAQLKTITQELNLTFEGREPEIKSVISQLRSFMGQLDANKGKIVSTLENVNRLALQLRRQDPSIKLALDEMPKALRSLDRQRDDLTRMLQALQQLSGVGVEVIQASKASTIDSLRSLAPVLREFADAGPELADALQVYLTYPFVDAAVGRDPVVAANLHMGDFTNLSMQLDVDLLNLPGLPGLPDGAQTIAAFCGKAGPDAAPLCEQLGILGLPTTLPKPNVPGGTGSGSPPSAPGPTDPLGGILGGSGPDSGTDSGSDSGSSGSGSGGLGEILGGLLGRTATGFDYSRDPFQLGVRGVDPALGTLLLQGVAIK